MGNLTADTSIRSLFRKITAAVLATLLLAASLPPPAEAQSCQGWNTAKFFATATVDEVRACLSAGQNLNERDAHGLAALHRAARQTSDPAVIEALLDAGANPRASSLDGRKPWDFGRRNKKIKGSDAYQRLMIAADSLKKVSARRADWSRVQAVPHDTKAAVRLYKDAAPAESRRIKGRFHSATEDSITLRLKDGRTRAFQKSYVRMVLIHRPFSKRWAGWITLAGSVLATEIFRIWVQDLPASFAALNLGIAAGATVVVFANSELSPIYNVPPMYRVLPQGDKQSGIQDDASGKQEEPGSPNG